MNQVTRSTARSRLRHPTTLRDDGATWRRKRASLERPDAHLFTYTLTLSSTTLRMSVEETLPPLPPPPRPPPSFARAPSLNGKRKAVWTYDPTPSSDPPLFSSDDHLASAVESEASVPRKRQYRGRWWETQRSSHASDAGRKREFKRTDDSGVWVASEDSNGSGDGDGDGDLPRAPTQDLLLERSMAPPCAVNYEIAMERDVRRPGGLGHSQPNDEPSAPEKTADAVVHDIVQKCLEDGIERVDLS